MILRDADARRGLRSVVQAIVALLIIGLLFWLTDLLRADVAGLREISRGALLIVGIGTLLYGAENVTRAVKFKTLLGEAEIGSGEAAQAVATSAQDTADDIKADGKPKLPKV